MRRLVLLASQPPFAGVHVEPDIPAIAARVGQDPDKTAAFLQGAAGTNILQRIRDDIAPIINGPACTRLGSRRPLGDQILRAFWRRSARS
jgi:hypothetical protein